MFSFDPQTFHNFVLACKVFHQVISKKDYKISKYKFLKENRARKTISFSSSKNKLYGPYICFYDCGIIDDCYKKFSFENLIEKEKVKIKGKYKNGFVHGKWETYYLNGQLRSKGKYEKGTKNGEWEGYYKDGTLHSKGIFKNDTKIGLWLKFHHDTKEIKTKNIFSLTPSVEGL